MRSRKPNHRNQLKCAMWYCKYVFTTGHIGTARSIARFTAKPLTRISRPIYIYPRDTYAIPHTRTHIQY